MANQQYTAKSIVTDSGLGIMRRRPTQYLPDMETAGLSHLIVELQDNSFDEATMLGEDGRVDIMLCPDHARKTFQCVVIDNGRGIPIDSLVASFTIPHTSGKYDTDAYTYSAGLFGVGAKVSAGLSRKFRAITSRGREGTGSIFVEKGTHGDKPLCEKGDGKRTGMTVVLEPDASMFTGVDTYVEGGWADLIERIKKYAYFHAAKVRFLIAKGPIPRAVWSVPNSEAIQLCEKHVEAADVIFDARSFDREDWLRRYLGANQPFTWSHVLTRRPDSTSSLSYNIQMYFSSPDSGYGRFGMINSVPIDTASSNHISEIIQTVSSKIEKMIPSKDVKTFFRESYKLSMYLAVEVMYEGAQFTGTTKHSFFSADFRDEYCGFLTQHFNTKVGTEALKALYELIAEDIQEKYILSITGQNKVKNKGRLFQELNFPDKFKNCTTPDRSRAELFIVEGDSAGGGISGQRDGETQAIYTVRGKPFNALKVTDNWHDAGIAARQDPIYQDLIRIIGINTMPGAPLDSLYFDSIVILTDADADGKHIASVLLGNFYAICPELITSGKVKVIIPPYYSVIYTGGRGGAKTKKQMFVRDDAALTHWMTQYLYKPSLDITVSFLHPHQTKVGQMTRSTYTLADTDYDGFIVKVLEIGEILDTLATELVIDPLVLEMLTHVSQHLDPGQVDASMIKEMLGADRVLYEPDGHILTISIGRRDYTVPLYRVTERMYDELFPVLNTVHWRRLEVYITSKNVDGFKDRLMTIGQLYSILRSFDELCYIKQHKGLAGLQPEDCYTICMDPAHRTSYPITSFSDIDLVFKLLGRDSENRKRLLAGHAANL